MECQHGIFMQDMIDEGGEIRALSIDSFEGHEPWKENLPQSALVPSVSCRADLLNAIVDAVGLDLRRCQVVICRGELMVKCEYETGRGLLGYK